MALSNDPIIDLDAERRARAHEETLLNDSLDAKPDDAARAYKLAQATGFPSTTILSDTDKVIDKGFKTQLAGQIVNDDEWLQKYVRSDPLAAHVSSDDWGNIWSFSKAMRNLWEGRRVVRDGVAGRPPTLVPESILPLRSPKETIETDIPAAYHHTVEGLQTTAMAIPRAFGRAGGWTEEGPIGQTMTEWARTQMEKEGWDKSVIDMVLQQSKTLGIMTDFAWEASAVLMTKLFRLPMWTAVAGMPIGGIMSEEISKPLEKTTGIPAWATDLSLMVGGMALGFKHLKDLREGETTINRVLQAGRQNNPYLLADRTPPVGSNHVVDHLHIKAAERENEQINETMKLLKQLATRERSPDHVQKLVNGMVGDAKVEVSGEAIRALYGNKEISADDGLLGFVADLRAQLWRHGKTGGPVKIRADEYYAKVPEEVEKALREHTRINPDGMTLAEAKALKEGGDPLTKAKPRGEIRSEDGAWRVYVDGQPQKGFITRLAAEEHLNQLVPEESLEGGMRMAAGVEGHEYIAIEEGAKPDVTPVNMLGERPGLTWRLPKPIMERIQKLRLRAEEARKQRQLDKAEARIREEQKPMWQERYDREIANSWEDIQTEPSYRAYRFFELGAVDDKNPGTGFKIDIESVLPEQRPFIPKRWMVKKGGLHIDDLADVLGIDSGETLIQAIAKLQRDRGKTGFGEYFNRLIYNEARNRMEGKYGKPGDQILAEAMDHVTDDHLMGVAYERWYAAAMMAGKALPQNFRDFRTAVVEELRSRPFSRRLIEDAHREMGKAHRESVNAATKKDWNGLFEAQQKYAYNHAIAMEAKKINKVIDSDDRFNARHQERSVPGVNQEHQDWINWVMHRTAQTVNRSRDDLLNSLDRHISLRNESGQYGKATGSPEGLRAFRDQHNEMGLPFEDFKYENEHSPLMVVADFLLKPDGQSPDGIYYKRPGEMSLAEFELVAKTKQSIAHWGKERYVQDMAGKKARHDDIVKEVVSQLEFWPEITAKYNKLGQSVTGGFKMNIRGVMADIIPIEFTLNRIARFDENASLMKYVYHPLVAGDNAARVAEMSFVRKMIELNKITRKIEFTKSLPHGDIWVTEASLVRDPATNKIRISDRPAFREMKVYNLFTAMLNVGTRSGLRKLAEGRGLTEDQVMEYINQHATKEMWNAVEYVWGLLKQVKQAEDVVNTRISGVGVPDEPTIGVYTPHGVNGRIQGEYYPVIHDRTDIRFSIGQQPENRFANYKVPGVASWEMERTGYRAPVSLDFSEFAGHMARRIRLLHMKEPGINAWKTFMDPRVTEAMTKHFGHHFNKTIKTYLEDVISAPTRETGSVQMLDKIVSLARRNVLPAVANFSLPILIKHAPTALIHGIREVGPINYVKAAAHLLANNKKAMGINETFIDNGGKVFGHDWDGSHEVQGRVHGMHTLTRGDVDTMMGRAPTLKEWREFGLGDASVMRTLNQEFRALGAWAIQRADMGIARTVWLAKYTAEMNRLAGEPGFNGWEAHLEANRIAEFAVRKALGSTALTAKSAIMRDRSVFWRSMTMFMGFFNNTFGRIMSVGWRSKDAFREWQQTGDYKELGRQWSIAGKDLMGYFVYTAIVEQIAENILHGHDPKESPWYTYAARPLLHLGFQVFPLGRELWMAGEHKMRPGMGATGTAAERMGKMVEMAMHFEKAFKNSRTQAQTLGNFLDALAVVGVPGMSFQTSNIAQAVYNLLVTGEEPETPSQFLNMWLRGTMREPRRHH